MSPSASSGERLRSLKDRHAGERCVIVANGPSLNGMSLGCLRRETVIGLNKIHLGLPRFGFYPRYLVAVNRRVVAQSATQIRAMNCVKFLGAQAARDAGIGEDGLTYHVDTGLPGAHFSTDPSVGLHEGWTVTHCALQIAFHLGFADVVLVGLDHRYQYEGRPNEARTMEGDDPNHFCADYFGGGQVWDNPDLVQSERAYRSALETYTRTGRRVRDATVGGDCKVFPKVEFKDLFLR